MTGWNALPACRSARLPYIDNTQFFISLAHILAMRERQRRRLDERIPQNSEFGSAPPRPVLGPVNELPVSR